MESFLELVAQLSHSLKKPLPGERAHAVMEASSAGYLGSRPGEQTRNSATLMLLYSHKNTVYFPLILRNSYDGFHSGEVSFPGGRQEPTDRNLFQTALREAQEEIGLEPKDVQILGKLTEIYIGPSDFLVLPILAFIPNRPDFLPDPREVEQIFEIPLHHFSEPDAVACSEIRIPGDVVVTPHYSVESHKVWGATAKVIAEVLFLLAENRPVKDGL